MANSNRHRQGVAYGPVRPSGSGDRGRVVGNVLGLLVVAGSGVLLAAGVYLLLQGGSAKSSPTPAPFTRAPLASSSGTPSVPTVSTFTPSAGPTVPSSIGITPPPTLYVPEVVSGPGYITFGSNVDADLRVTDPKTTFAVDEPMVWSSDLTEPADSADLQIQIYKLDAKQPTGQRLVRTDEVQPAATNSQVYFRRLRPLGASLGTGLFTVKYVRSGDVLATGSFLIQ